MAATENFALPLPQMGEPADIRVLNRGTEEIDGIMNGNRTMFAPAWVNTETYHVGSRVVYLGEYYVCKEDNVTGAWDATKWDHKTVGEDIEDSTGGASALADLDDVEITSPTQGQALVYDGTDWVNGNGSGGGGMFIDTGNVIVPYTSLSGQALSYTASQDCAVVVDNVGSSDSSSYVYIDGVQVGRIYSSSGMQITGQTYYLKEGQTISTSRGGIGSNYVAYAVYGLAFTPQNLQPVIYSTDEREIGVWTDGKPLYQKTWRFTSSVTLASGWNQLPITKGELEQCAYADAGEDDGTILSYISVSLTQPTYIYVFNVRSDSAVIDFITIQYTKTTDSPGSGTWTPQGVPAHHYSTDEQVVGTWVDGSTLYEKTIKKQNISSVSTSTVLISSSELTGMNIVEISGSYISTTTASTYPINAYINSNSMITTWLAEGDIYYWLYWGAADTYDAYITIRYTKS